MKNTSIKIDELRPIVNMLNEGGITYGKAINMITEFAQKNEFEYSEKLPYWLEVKLKQKEMEKSKQTKAHIAISMKCLKAQGYEPEYKEKENYSEIVFKSFGSDNFKEEHKNIQRAIFGKRLMEFYYGDNLQSIYIEKPIE